jgi:TPR repeat protein
VALAHHDGRGVPQDLSRALAYYAKACDAGFGAGCQNVGDLHLQLGGPDALGKARPAWAKAAEIYRRACDKGALELCVNLATLHEDGKLAPEGAAPGSDADKKELLTAVALFKRACSGGDIGGCINLSTLYLAGHGVPRDEAKARSLLKRGCDSLKPTVSERTRLEAAGACGNLALMVEATDPKQAITLHRKACDAGQFGACRNLGVLLSRAAAPDFKAADALFRKGCDGGDASSCWNLALSLDAGAGGTRDPAAARSLRDRASKMGLKKACP